MCAQWLSCLRLFETPWTVAHQATLSMGFSRQEYWSGLPCPPPRDLPNPGTEPTPPASPALVGRFFTTSTTWEVLALGQITCQASGYLNVCVCVWGGGGGWGQTLVLSS